LTGARIRYRVRRPKGAAAAMPHAIPVRNPFDRAATTGAFLANGLAFGVWAGNLPRLKEAQGLSDSALGLMLLMLSIGAVGIMPITGLLAERLGHQRIAACAGVGIAAVLALPALSAGWPALLASAIVLGTLLGMMDVAMNGHASDVEIAWRAPIMSSFHAGWSIGGLLGSAIAGLLASQGVGLAASYALPAILVAALALPGFALASRPTGPQAGKRLALPTRAILGITALAGLCFVSEGAVADWSGVYLRSELGTDAAWAAAAFGFYSMAMAVGRLTGDAVVRRLGPGRVVRLGGGLAAFGLALVLAVQDPLAVDVGLVLVGLGLSNIVPVAFSAAGRLQGTTGIAMCATMGYAGFMVGPPVIGAIADLAGLRVALLLILAGMLTMVTIARAVASERAPVSAGSA
jgi:MFS family permease